MKCIFSSKKTDIFLTEDKKIIKNIKKCGDAHKESEIQKKAHIIGVSPEVYSYTKGSITMEYIEGCTLEEYKKKNRCDDIKQKIINAINILYDNNIDHKDLGDKNIMITFNNEIKIIDFGYSIITSEIVPIKKRFYPLNL